KADQQRALLQAALHAYEMAAAVLERVRERTISADDQVHLGEEVTAIFPRRLGVLARLHALGGKPEHLRAAFQAAEQGTGPVFPETLGWAVAQVTAGIDPRLLAEANRLLGRLRALDREMVALTAVPDDRLDAEATRRLHEQRREVAQEYAAHRKRMEKEYPQY